MRVIVIHRKLIQWHGGDVHLMSDKHQPDCGTSRPSMYWVTSRKVKLKADSRREVSCSRCRVILVELCEKKKTQAA